MSHNEKWLKTLLNTLVIMGISFTAVLSFQNCGEISIQPVAGPAGLEVAVSSRIHACSQLEPGLAVENYEISPLVIMNLTAIMTYKNGSFVLLADSDLDGIPDEEDAEPTTREVAGLMNAICKSMGGESLCNATCTPSSRHFGLNNCDREVLVLGSNPLRADFDRDLAPDFIEALYGLLPKSQDFNRDGDGIETTINEFLVGRNPVLNDDSAPSNLFLQTRRELIPASDSRRSGINCASNQQLWQSEVLKIPLASTVAYDDSISRRGDAFDFTHDANENILLIYYYTRNFSNTRTEIWGKLVTINELTTTLEVSPYQYTLIGSY